MPQVQHFAARRAIIMLNYSLACGFWHIKFSLRQTSLQDKEEPVLALFHAAKYPSLI
jgi:hypothetical protein